MNNPFLSVVMSTLNTDQTYLKESIDSILNQTYKNFEFIIIIDGGNDDKYIKENYNDSRLKIIKHETSKGLPASLNEGIRIAKGKYIARMDSDDISIYNRFENQIKYMETHPEIDITSMYYKEIGIGKKVVKEKFISYKQVKSKLFFVNIIAHPSVMFRKKSILEKNLFYNEEYFCSQDFELWNRYDNVKIEIIPQIGLEYRIHNNQISSSKRELQNKFYFSVLENNLKKLDLENYLEGILVLNGRKESQDYKKIYEFIKKAIYKNNEKLIYDSVEFNKILKTQYEVYCVKNKKILNKYFIFNIKYLFMKFINIRRWKK